MTLVVAIMEDNATFMMSDTMLSVESEQRRLPEVSFPTQAEKPFSTHRPVTGLSQKVVEIKPGLFIGWAGSFCAARRYIGWVRDNTKSPAFGFKDMELLDTQYWETHPEDVHELQIIIHFCKGDDVFLRAINGKNIADVDGWGTVAAIGSGAHAFFAALDSKPLQARSDDRHRIPVTGNKIHYIMRYMLRTMNQQQDSGFALDDAWGAGFEFVLGKGGEVSEKMNNILLHSYTWSKKGSEITVDPIGKKYFQYTVDDKLSILSQAPGKALECHVALPPDKDPLTDVEPFASEKCRPQMVCTILDNLDIGQSWATVDWNEYGHPCCEVVSIGQSGAFIMVDPSYIDGLIRQHALTSD